MTAKAPTVPARNDLKKVELSRNSRAQELRGQKPGFQYQAFSLEPDHPSYIGKKLVRHEIGDQSVGFAVVEPWELCEDVTNSTVRALDPRTDQGAPIDSKVRYGRQVVCRLPDQEFAKYGAVDTAKRDLRKRQLYGSPDRLRLPGASMTSYTSNDESEGADYMSALAQAGHPMPAR